MGSYANLSIGDYSFFNQQSYVDSIFLTIFQESDKRVSEYIDEDGEGNIQHVFQYTVEARYVIQRLEIMGFTLTKTKQLFNEGIANVLEQVNDGYYFRPFGMNRDEKIQFFSGFTFERWSSALHEVITKGIFRYGDKNKEIIASNVLIRFILGDDFNDDFFYGFPNSDPRYFLRAALEVFESTDEVVLDISELVDNGYYKETDKLTEIARSGLSFDYAASAKIIVLTEGSSDRAGSALRVHHSIPLVVGGLDIPANMITYCLGCHYQEHSPSGSAPLSILTKIGRGIQPPTAILSTASWIGTSGCMWAGHLDVNI